MSNPALANLAPLVGRWRMELDGAAFLPNPDTRLTDWDKSDCRERIIQPCERAPKTSDSPAVVTPRLRSWRTSR